MKRILIAMSLIAMVSCHRSVPPPVYDGVLPDFGTGGDDAPAYRPDDDSAGLDAELANDALRYSGPELALDYRQGGVMYVIRSQSEHAFYDIDGNSRAIIIPGHVGSDGITYEDTRLNVNGADIDVISARRIKVSDGLIWLLMTDADGNRHIAVIES